MSQPERFEVLGSGTGGKLVAWHMAQSGWPTAVVERQWIGGSCVNVACMPSKNEISSAKVAHLVRHAAQYGAATTSLAVWAIGECAGSPQFTHISEDDFRIIRDNLAGGNRSTRDRLIAYCMFTDPLLAHVGLSEGEAERQGVGVRIAKLPMNSVLGAQATEQGKDS